MSGRNVCRAVSGVGAVVVATGFAVTVSAGVADAVPQTVTWTDGQTVFTRTISDVEPGPGDTFTSSTRVETPDASETIPVFTDICPACLTFQSAQVDGKPLDFINTIGPDFVTISSVDGSWDIPPKTNDPESHTFEFAYRVDEGCERSIPLTTGVSYEFSNGAGSHTTEAGVLKITVGLGTSTTAFDAMPSHVQIGQQVRLTATVTGGAIGDTVEFYDDSTKVGTAALDDTGVAAFDWTPDTQGAYLLTAKFLGNPQTRSSQSSMRTVQVSDAETATGSAGNIFGS
ncbi:Ig-like domain-containing protein [Rhodococcus marinonascens]|uniref:Ig-like domain-containing protein n=1 Tax=Rhodococcus marinonascens TaxID=38311 RepID=UPI0009328E1B|nr:Ig-like domain-containing protein [Rhodococcus marinonascens]